MFLSTYDLANFGVALRERRTAEKLSQQEVRNLTGIHTDTLRRIEKGESIPKYSTLEILSGLYKVNLIELLASYKIQKNIYDLYQELDHIIISNRPDLLDSLNTIITNIDFKSHGWNLVYEVQYQQLKIFINLVKDYYNKLDSDQLIYSLQACLRITVEDFKLRSLKSFAYNHLELRILLLISLVLVRKKKYNQSNELLCFIYDALVNRMILTKEEKKLIIKTLSNLSYNYYKDEDFDNSLHYAELGIKFAKSNDTLYSLYLLYARKAVAKYFLQEDDIETDVINCIAILDILGLYKLKEQYIKIFKAKYNIVLTLKNQSEL